MSEEEDDILFQEAFDESQKALQEANLSSNQMETLRNDLESYVQLLSLKIDSNGQKLITIPTNFEAISQAMTRDDLFGNENNENSNKNQWSKCLFNKQFNKEFDRGRYNKILQTSDKVDNEKIDSGLAEIHLLDSQLKLASKRATKINREIDDQIDSTFVTRHRGGESNQSAMTTPRTLTSRTSTTEKDFPSPENFDKDDATIPSTAIDEKVKILPKKITSKLSSDEELRIQAILHDNYDDYINETSDYGYMNNKIIEIDEKLMSYGRLERFDVSSIENEILKENSIPIQLNKQNESNSDKYFIQEQVRHLK